MPDIPNSGRRVRSNLVGGYCPVEVKDSAMAVANFEQVRSELTGKKVVVLNLAEFSMAIGSLTNVTTGEAKLSLHLDSDKGEKLTFSLEEPVSAPKTDTGYRFESSKIILQVDFMPE